VIVVFPFSKKRAQPINKETGLPDVKGTAARVHDAVVKRLRVQLVRAAGDVGNINIVEQQAAEKLIPGFYDSASAAMTKRAYLQDIAKAINDNSPSEVKRVLDEAGIGYVDLGKQEIEIPWEIDWSCDNVGVNAETRLLWDQEFDSNVTYTKPITKFYPINTYRHIPQGMDKYKNNVEQYRENYEDIDWSDMGLTQIGGWAHE